MRVTPLGLGRPLSAGLLAGSVLGAAALVAFGRAAPEAFWSVAWFAVVVAFLVGVAGVAGPSATMGRIGRHLGVGMDWLGPRLWMLLLVSLPWVALWLLLIAPGYHDGDDLAALDDRDLERIGEVIATTIAVFLTAILYVLWRILRAIERRQDRDVQATPVHQAASAEDA